MEHPEEAIRQAITRTERAVRRARSVWGDRWPAERRELNQLLPRAEALVRQIAEERVPGSTAMRPRAMPRKLTPAQVRQIRTSPKTQVELAAEYGISQSAISEVKRYETYAWVEDGVDENAE